MFLADDQAWLRSAERLLLEQEPDVEIVGEAAEVKSLLAKIEVLCPDLVLLDWELPGLKSSHAGRQLLMALHAYCPDLTVIVLSGRPEAGQLALAAGADYFVSKADPPESLLGALRKVKGMNSHMQEP